MPPRPNVLFLTCHDLGQHLGCYGRSTINSPALDALAASGVRLASSFCTAPQCSPSRAALHTGRYPHATGVLGLAHHPFDWELAPGERHLARRLHDVGYATAIVGIQHVSLPEHADRLGFEQISPPAPAHEEAATAIGLLRALSSSERPFYLEVGFEEPHRPYDFGGVQPDDSRGVTVPPYLPQAPESKRDLAAFQGAVRVMDSGAGAILTALDGLACRDDTWVVFATDHGVAMPRAKCTLYDPGIETALLMRLPAAGVGGGRVYDQLISNVDVVPTMLEGLGLPVPSELHGRSFWSLLKGASFRPRQEVFAEKTFHTYYEPMRAIRTQTHKLIFNLEMSTSVDVPGDVRMSPIYPLMIEQLSRHRPQVELYDLVADPWEQANVADDPGWSTIQSELRERLLAWMLETRDPLLEGPVASPYYRGALARLMLRGQPG
jgi:arylsulfatase A-like enzyme